MHPIGVKRSLAPKRANSLALFLEEVTPLKWRNLAKPIVESDPHRRSRVYCLLESCLGSFPVGKKEKFLYAYSMSKHREMWMNTFPAGCVCEHATLDAVPTIEIFDRFSLGGPMRVGSIHLNYAVRIMVANDN